MIEKMKKFTFLVTDREYEGFIESIRELGVVHVTQLQQGATSTELQEAIYLEQRYARALDFLKIYGTKYALKLGAVAPEYDTPLSLLQKVEDLQVQENVLLHEEDEL
ncbi:MAG: V-type ATP synthase subunit I, partial [Bacteroidaceae bacterium]|nr:V-type ATP synthase subunit I [Bacteroidaceae bacterium]